MKLKLGAQIGLGFGGVILIAGFLGSLAIFNMAKVSTLSTQLADEYAPEVEVAYKLDNAARDTMYEMRGYAFTEDKSFLAEGREHMKEVHTHMAAAKQLAEKSAHLLKLKGQLAGIESMFAEFGRLVDDGEAADDQMDMAKDDLIEAAKKFIDYCHEYLAGQNNKLAKQFTAGAKAKSNLERLHKISVINDVLELSSVTQIATWQALAERDVSLIHKAQENFVKINAKLDELISLSSKSSDIKRLTEVKKAGAIYDEHMDEVADNWVKVQELSARRAKLGEDAVASVRAAATAGLANTLKVAGVTVDTLSSSSTIMVVGLIIAMAAGGLIAYFITVSITRPVAKTVYMLDEMASGHLDQRLNMDREDEIGQMARTMDRFADSLKEEMVAALDMLANGDLTFDAKPFDDRDAIRNALKKTGDDLNKLISEILVATEQVASGAGQVSDSSQALSQGATEQAASLEEITSSMTEMASQTKLNAENATQANQLASQTRSAAEGGNARMQEMVAAMGEINEAGQNISKIIKVIDEIAFQTNLLALNAAVEAARAGRHGKGFAVVAEEVRNLAARSAKAAKETAELIEGSVAKTRNGTEIAQSTSEALSNIVTSVTKVTDLVGEIAAASNEQAQGIGQTNQALGQIDQVTQQNTASAEESAAASEELSGQAMHMKEMMSRFRLRDNGFGAKQHALPAGTGKKARKSDWGGGEVAPVAARLPKPEVMIDLDDNEFGKY